jgi:uncharacterized 2Fe-2S/4Fe-4S cluster protein (DUF4445 family)
MTDHLVLFMPSGKRGRFPRDTPVLEAARQLGVHVESVCGGRGICGRCQVEVQEGVFAKHGITSSNDHISAFGGNEVRYAENAISSRAAGCPARPGCLAIWSSTFRRMPWSMRRWCARIPTVA